MREAGPNVGHLGSGEALIYTRGFRTVMATVLAIAALGAWWWIRVRAHDRARYEAACARVQREVGSLDPEDYRAPSVPDSENAVAELKAAIGACEFRLYAPQRSRASSEMSVCTDGYRLPVDPVEIRKIRARIEANREALTHLRSSARMPGVDWDVEDPTEPYSPFPDVPAIVGLSRLLQCDARIAMLDGRPGDAIGDVETASVLAGLDERPRLTLRLGMFFERRALRAVRELAEAPGLTSSELRRLREVLPRSDLRATWRARWSLRVAQNYRIGEMELNEGSDFHPGKGRFLRWQTHRLHAQAGELAALERGRAVGRLLPSILAERRPETPFPGGVAWGDDFSIELEEFDRMLACLARRNLARRAIDLRLEAVEAGAYPGELDPPSTYDDDPLSGEPFSYTRLWDGSALLEALSGWEETQEIFGRDGPEEWTWRLPPPPKRN